MDQCEAILIEPLGDDSLALMEFIPKLDDFLSDIRDALEALRNGKDCRVYQLLRTSYSTLREAYSILDSTYCK